MICAFKTEKTTTTKTDTKFSNYFLSAYETRTEPEYCFIKAHLLYDCQKKTAYTQHTTHNFDCKSQWKTFGFWYVRFLKSCRTDAYMALIWNVSYVAKSCLLGRVTNAEFTAKNGSKNKASASKLVSKLHMHIYQTTTPARLNSRAVVCVNRRELERNWISPSMYLELLL